MHIDFRVVQSRTLSDGQHFLGNAGLDHIIIPVFENMPLLVVMFSVRSLSYYRSLFCGTASDSENELGLFILDRICSVVVSGNIENLPCVLTVRS